MEQPDERVNEGEGRGAGQGPLAFRAVHGGASHSCSRDARRRAGLKAPLQRERRPAESWLQARGHVFWRRMQQHYSAVFLCLCALEL